MKCLTISYTILVFASVIFNCTFQLCMGRPEETKKPSDNQTVYLQFGPCFYFCAFCELIFAKTNPIIFIKNSSHIK